MSICVKYFLNMKAQIITHVLFHLVIKTESILYKKAVDYRENSESNDGFYRTFFQ